MANGEIIAEIKSSDQSLYEAESWKDYDFSSLLHNKQQIYRSYSSNNDLAMIIDDAKLYSEVLTYMKAKQDFSIVLLNNSSWSTFFFPGNSEFQSYVSSSRPSSHLELIKNKYIYYENVLMSFRQLLPSDYNWVCNPQALTTMVKFVNKERLKNVTIDSDLCLALRTASVDNILLTDPSLNIYSESLIEKMLKMNALEKFIWKLVLFINNFQSNQLIPSINEFNELSTEDQLLFDILYETIC